MKIIIDSRVLRSSKFRRFFPHVDSQGSYVSRIDFQLPTLYRNHSLNLQDEELATFYKQKFNNELNERIANQSNYEETNQRGAVMFNYQKLI